MESPRPSDWALAMENLKRFARDLAIWSPAFLYCHYRVGLSWGTSGFIWLGLGLLTRLEENDVALRKLIARSEAASHRWLYQVVIFPQWHNLLLDYRLINGTDEFRQVWEKGLKDS